MDENNSYIEPRLKLIDHLKKYGPRDITLDDHARAKDRTTNMVKTWSEVKAEERILRHRTLDCITFTTKGKIEVHDSGELESLNVRIAALSAHREAMEAAIEKLSADAPGFLCDLRKARAKAQETIENGPVYLNRQLGIEMKDNGLPIETAMKSHRYLRAKESSDAFTAAAKAKLAEVEPLIATIEEQLDASEKFLVNVG